MRAQLLQDTNTFASASLDRTVKVWSITNLQPHFTLEGHDKGVNCVEYFAGGDRPYLVTGAGAFYKKLNPLCTFHRCCVTGMSSQRLIVYIR